MDKDWLAVQIDLGRSIESIAREVGKDGSTVSYWVRKHGLRSAHAERHAPRGGIDRATLEQHIEAGASTREIAEALDRSQGTVRHWLRRHGLKTRRASRRAPDFASTLGTCPTHGEVEFALRADGRWRCLKCRSQHVSDRRRRVKALLIEEAGGGCSICGYDRSVAALQFHHLDPSTKRFGIGHGTTLSLAVTRAEAEKCVLLCANCHAEVEAGVATLPSAPGLPSPVAHDGE